METEEFAELVASELKAYLSRTPYGKFARISVLNLEENGYSVIVDCNISARGNNTPVEIGIEEGGIANTVPKEVRFDFIEEAIMKSLKKASVEEGFMRLKRL